MAAAVEIEAQKVQGKKGVEAFIRARLALVQKELEGISGKVLGQVAGIRKSLETVPHQALERVKAAIKVERLDQLKALISSSRAPIADATAKVEKAVNDGVKLTEEAVQKLGLAKLADVSALKDAFEGLQKRIDQLKKKVDGLAKSPTTAPEATVSADSNVSQE
jgi:cell division septum initiation protein DivIVA